MQALVVLHEDVQIVPLAEIPPHVRSQLEGQEGDFAITRPFSRNPSKVIDANAASLLRQFRNPRTIVEGILAYSREARVRASDVLEEAYPLIESCLQSNLLVEPGTTSEKIRPTFSPGDSIDGNIVERPIQALMDSEVYQVRTRDGRLAVLKIATAAVARTMEKMLTREADLLRHIGGAPAPAFLDLKTEEGSRPWLLAEWCEGEDGETWAGKIRTGTPDSMDRIASVCANVVEAYATLHERGVIHGDIHPRNMLISETGEVRIIDFGVSHLGEAPPALPSRAGVAFFFEPEYAQAAVLGLAAPAQTLVGEQYGIAALLYFLLCGSQYVDFSFNKETLLRQIANDKPLPFERRRASYPAALQEVVMRALEKDPARRFESTRHFAQAFRKSLEPGVDRRNAIHNTESKLLLERVLGIIDHPNRALEYVGPASPAASVTYGQAGIALAAYRIACQRDDARLFALADAWAERSAVIRTGPFYNEAVHITPETVGLVSPYHTASGIAAVQAMLASARGDMLNLDAAVSRYLAGATGECSNPDLTLGHASVLLGLILILEASGTSRPPDLMERGNQLCDLLTSLMQEQPAIGQPGAISYLGMAHGWAGLLYAILRWSQLTDTHPPVLVEDRLGQLANYARFVGGGTRWPVQTGQEALSMVGWCNGSAGHVFLWTLADRIYGKSRYRDLAAGAAVDAYRNAGGGHALCCGFAGQAYAQLSLYNHTGEQIWLEQARILTEKAAAAGNRLAEVREDCLPHSLYKGDIGVAVLIAEIEKPETAAMPFFESAR